MSPRRPTWMLALLAALPAGCAVRGDVDMLESELRRQEETQQQFAEELKSTREELRVARSDADNLRAQLSQRGQHSLVSEQAEVLYKAEAIKFNMMLTSGANRDGQPGDDGISVLLQPVDAQGDLVKLVGAVDLELLDLNREGEAQRMGRWQFTTEEVRDHWHRGFLSAGYLFQLDWQTIPASAELTLHAKLTAPDGRKFDATTQVRVDPTGSQAAPVAQARRESTKPSKGVIQAAASQPADAKMADAKMADAKMADAKSTEPPRPPRKLRQRAATRKAAGAKGTGLAPLETSDNFTDETIPRLR